MGVTTATGFTAGTSASGARRSAADDVCVILSVTPAAAAAVFTTNQMAAPPIAQSREAIADGTLSAIVVNAGNANACTGPKGLADARAMAERTATALGLAASDVAVASTGVIGQPLDLDALMPAIDDAASDAASVATASGTAADEAAARAIMTTDTFSKQVATTFAVGDHTYAVGGMAKGAGMIRPDMATMLCFVTTDAPLSATACERALAAAVGDSFNRITVDGETSTNDVVYLLANGAAGGEPIDHGDEAFAPLAEAVAHVCAELARAVVKDGEGATKFVEIVVSGARDDFEAHAGAMAIADSLLFKCAIFGQDANWGRVVSAIGASRATVDPDLIAVSFAGIEVARAGMAVPFDENAAAAALAADEITVAVDLGLGTGEAVVWTCDLSYDYVKINADYRT